MNVPSLIALYGAGLLTFASPCVLPLLPMYLATLAGPGGQAGQDGPSAARRTRLAGVGFSLGLGAVMALLGAGASSIARSLSSHASSLQWAAAGLMALFGLKQLGLVSIPALDREARPLLDRVRGGGGLAGGVLFGAAFGLGWTPCVGPVLGAALTYAASTGASPWSSALLLGAYAAGLASPLLAASFLAPQALRLASRLRAHTPVIQKASGALLLAVAALVAWGAAGRSASPEPMAGGSASSCQQSSLGCGVEGLGEPGQGAEAGVVEGPLLIELVSGHCPVCARMAPVVDRVNAACSAGDRPGIVRIDVDSPRGKALASKHAVRVVPTFLSIDASGAEVERRVGEQPLSTLEQMTSDASGRLCRAPSPSSPTGG